MLVSHVIARLEDLEAKYGDREVNVYTSFSKTTAPIRDASDIDFDEGEKDIYIGVYA